MLLVTSLESGALKSQIIIIVIMMLIIIIIMSPMHYISCIMLFCHSVYRGGICGTVVVRWTAGQQVDPVPGA